MFDEVCRGHLTSLVGSFAAVFLCCPFYLLPAIFLFVTFTLGLDFLFTGLSIKSKRTEHSTPLTVTIPQIFRYIP